MTHWTQAQLDDYLTRTRKAFDEKEEADPGPESRLQGKIVAWCKEWGRPCLSFRQSKKAQGFLTPGWPDVTVCLPNGRVIFLELKSAKGILKDDQRAIHLQLMALGHEIHVCRSFRRFLEIVETKSPHEGAG